MAAGDSNGGVGAGALEKDLAVWLCNSKGELKAHILYPKTPILAGWLRDMKTPMFALGA